MKYQEIQNILKNSKIVLIIGLSRDNNKDSNIIAQYLLKNNYQIIGINPNSNRILNIKCYKELRMVPKNQLKNIDIINIFRPSNELIGIIKQIIHYIKGMKYILQATPNNFHIELAFPNPNNRHKIINAHQSI